MNKLNIFSQNIHKNALIVNFILKTYSHFNIILIQEPSWSIIRLIPSSASSEGEVLVVIRRVCGQTLGLGLGQSKDIVVVFY